MTGKELLEVIENGVSQWPKLEGRFPQVSGLAFRWSSTQPGGHRVLADTVLVAGNQLQQDKVYTVGTKEFMRKGRDGYDILAHCKCIAGSEDY
eukprot:4779849-Amphidinium_carterae.1